MVKKAERKNPTRTSALVPTGLGSTASLSIQKLQAQSTDLEQQARRIRRHLEDLERTNYTESGSGAGGFRGRYTEVDEDGDEGGVEEGPGEVGQFGKGEGGTDGQPGKKRKKHSQNVRSLLIYRKNLPTLLEESLTRQPPLPSTQPPYASLLSRPPTVPLPKSHITCTVCGFPAAYRCLKVGCGMRICSMFGEDGKGGCWETHDEERCERRVG